MSRRPWNWIALWAVVSLACSLPLQPGAVTPTPDVAQIGLACALGYLDLRFEGKWRERYPKLVKWLDDFAVQTPSFAATKAH